MTELSSALAEFKHYIWEGEEPNPYRQILSWCDRLIVTGDSHNMVSEALATGRPVGVFRPAGLSKKLCYFLDRLEAEGLVADMDGGFGKIEARTVDATPKIAAEVKRRFETA